MALFKLSLFCDAESECLLHISAESTVSLVHRTCTCAREGDPFVKTSTTARCESRYKMGLKMQDCASSANPRSLKDSNNVHCLQSNQPCQGSMVNGSLTQDGSVKNSFTLPS